MRRCLLDFANAGAGAHVYVFAFEIGYAIPMFALVTALVVGAPAVLVRADDARALPAGAEHLGGPFYRVRELPARSLSHWRGVRWAAPDARRRVVLDQSDSAEPLQWHLANDGSRTDLWPRIEAGADIGAREAWAITRGNDRVVVAVLDGGIPADHPDLPASRREPGWDFVDSDADPSPVGDGSLAAHGTAVAALAVGARNGAGVVGVCPGCRLLPVRVLAPDSTARDGDLVAALLWAAERADVINASWSFDAGTYVPRAIHEAIRWAAEHGRGGRGAVLVFSAGNRAQPIDPFTPEAMVETITVGAADERDLRAGYSNHGELLTLMAPGGVADEIDGDNRVARAKLVTADLEGDGGNNPRQDAVFAPGIVSDLAVTAAFRGTSASTPLVSGAAALVLSADPELTATQVAWLLTETAAPVGGVTYVEGRHGSYGHGRLDAGAAVALASAGGACLPAGELCANGADDDCDRLVDALDPDCGAERPRAFELPLVACTDDDACGDGHCGAPDGRDDARLCTAECDFDCPDAGACVGREGSSRCLPACARRSDCPAGTTCALPTAGLVPPGQDPRPVCLPVCNDDRDCHGAFCWDGACAGDEPQRLVEPPAPEHGCAAAPGSWALVLAAWVTVRRRARGTTRGGAFPAGKAY